MSVINAEHSSMPMLRPVVVALVYAGALSAQGKNRIELDVAMQHLAHRDAVASPMAYSGVGTAGSLTYSRLTWHRDFRLGMTLSMPTLESSLTSGGVPRQNIDRFQLDLAALPGDASDRRRVGPRISADVAYRDYLPSGSGAANFSYLFVHVAAGAAIDGSARLGSTAVSYRVGVPIAGMVSRPYTDLRILWREGMGWRFATPFTLQTADVQVSLTGTARPNPRWRLVYRGYLALYDRSTPYRAIENSVGLRLTIGRLGAGR